MWSTVAADGRLLAVKVIKDDGHPDRAACIRDEVDILQGLDGHPNVIRLLAATGPYLFMEHGGTDLRKWVTHERRPIRLRAWVRELLSGLVWAHDHGVLHLDLKPTNLVVDRRTGTLKILDWGNAQTLDPPRPDHPPPYDADGDVTFTHMHRPDRQPQ